MPFFVLGFVFESVLYLEGEIVGRVGGHADGTRVVIVVLGATAPKKAKIVEHVFSLVDEPLTRRAIEGIMDVRHVLRREGSQRRRRKLR